MTAKPAINRRTFIKTSAAFGSVSILSNGHSASAQSPKAETFVPFRAITNGAKSHWFGYYDKIQFCPENRFVLGMEVGFNDRSPKPGDEIILGMVDLQDNDRWIPFGSTTAWCWQQGCMLQWLPGSTSKVIYNTRAHNGYRSEILDILSGEKQTLPMPVYAVSPTGKTAVCPNFSRLGSTRPGYGYNGFSDPFADVHHSDQDGIYAMDLESGDAKLIITLDQISKFRSNDTMNQGDHWFNHLLFNTDGERFIFLHRWRHEVNGRRTWFTRMFTAQPNGDELYCVADHDMVSHFIWKNPEQILAWSKEPNRGNRFHLYTDQSEACDVIGDGVLMQDGHCTYSPDGEWILVDTYPDQNRLQHLRLYRPSDGKLVKLGAFYLSPDRKGETRCDLHPRWSRDGKTVCIDSLHSGKRQLYVMDVSESMS